MTSPKHIPKEQLVNELCVNGNLVKFRETIYRMLTVIYQNGATVSCKYNETASNIDSNPERPKHIRVSMIQVKDPLNIVWNIMHEYGHYLDWPRIIDHTVIEREENAWKLAEIEIQKYPQLVKEIERFKKHRDWCLETYYTHCNKTSKSSK